VALDNGKSGKEEEEISTFPLAGDSSTIRWVNVLISSVTRSERLVVVVELWCFLPFLRDFMGEKWMACALFVRVFFASVLCKASQCFPCSRKRGSQAVAGVKLKTLPSEFGHLTPRGPKCLYPLALNGTDGTDGAATGKYGLASGTTPNIFGVSGYSGAGTNPSDKNNPIKLENNLMPYSLSNHIHEREIGQFIGRKVHFMPHVASHFRGISLTVSMELDQPCHDANELYEQYVEYYRNDPLIRVMKGIPEVAWNAGGHHVVVGGFTVSECGRRAWSVSPWTIY